MVETDFSFVIPSSRESCLDGIRPAHDPPCSTPSEIPGSRTDAECCPQIGPSLEACYVGVSSIHNASQPIGEPFRRAKKSQW